MLGSSDWESICPDVAESLAEWLKKVADVRMLPQLIRHRFLVIILDLVWPSCLSLPPLTVIYIKMPAIKEKISESTDSGRQVMAAIQALHMLEEDKDLCDLILAGQISNRCFFFFSFFFFD
jgi:hypothetical protein